MQVDVGAKRERAADEPAEESTENAAEESHHAGLDEEKLLDVAIGGAESFQHANFAAAFENGHDQRVDDAERGDGQSKAAEDAQEKIEHGEENSQALGSIEKRESAEAQVFDFGFCGFHERGIFHADGEAGVGGLVAGRISKNVAQIVDLCGAKSLGNRKWDEQAPAAKAAETGGRLRFNHADDAQMLFFGDHRKAA